VWAFFVYISVGCLNQTLRSPLKIIMTIIFALVLSDERAAERGTYDRHCFQSAELVSNM